MSARRLSSLARTARAAHSAARGAGPPQHSRLALHILPRALERHLLVPDLVQLDGHHLAFTPALPLNTTQPAHQGDLGHSTKAGDPPTTKTSGRGRNPTPGYFADTSSSAIFRSFPLIQLQPDRYSVILTARGVIVIWECFILTKSGHVIFFSIPWSTHFTIQGCEDIH